MIRLIVTADALGIPMAWVPMCLLSHLGELFPSKAIVTAFATHEVQVAFPGRNAAGVQDILDELSATTSGREGLATWPGLHLDGREGPEAQAGDYYGDRRIDRCRAVAG